METPTSTRRITRSQTKAAAATVILDHDDHPIKNLSSASSKYSRKDRSVLFDISNDSPVLGLAMGSMKKKKSGRNHRRFREIRTPGSGEALLRDQVKILLKKVEEDQPQLLGGGHFLGFNGGAAAGGGLTPANTPLAFFIKKPSQDGSLKKETHQRSIRKNLFL